MEDIKIQFECDRLIAQFMGYALKTPEMRNEPEKWKDSYWEKKTKEHGTEVLGREGFLQYSTSWNWLMKVVDKIENLTHVSVYFNKTKKSKYKIEISYETPNYFPKQKNKTVFIESENKIEAVYLAVVEFIRWYIVNKNND